MLIKCKGCEEHFENGGVCTNPKCDYCLNSLKESNSIKSPAPIAMFFGSKLLSESIESITKTNPRSFIIVYEDPTDRKIVVSADGLSLVQQLGMLEIAKMMLIQGRISE